MGKLVDTSEAAIVLNWLKLNQRMAARENERRRQVMEKAEKEIRVADLKKVWEQMDK